jgi:hypothetical protein
MSQPNGLLILGDHLFLNYKKIGQRALINTAGSIDPNLTLPSMTIHKMGRAIVVQASALALLNGATWLFQLVGLGGQR